MDIDTECPYYHKNIDASQAENLLKGNGSNGCFLIRDSRHREGGYTLCLL